MLGWSAAGQRKEVSQKAIRSQRTRATTPRPICAISTRTPPKPTLSLHCWLLISSSMQPPPRKNRSTNNPGFVDLPKSRRSSSEVAAEKERKKVTAAANAQKKREQAARVARVEREIKTAQEEGTRLSRQGSRVKKTFSRSASFEDRGKVVGHASCITSSSSSLILFLGYKH